MADDYNDGRFRKDQIRDIVRKARQQLGIATERVFDLVKILSAGWINTVKGRKRLVLIVVPDDELGASDAKTKCAGDCVRIAVKRSVWTALVSVPEDDEALVKLRQAKFTLAHEYFHGVLWHDQAVMSRLSGELRASQKIKGLTRFESAEGQADYAAACFLIPIELIEENASPKIVSEKFDVNLTAAKIAWEEFERSRPNPRVVKGFEELLLSLRSGASHSQATKPSQSTQDRSTCTANENSNALTLCLRCGRRKAGVMANKLVCEECRLAGDFYQDGDPLLGRYDDGDP